MKTIHTLIPDIYHLVQNEKDWFNGELAETFSKEVALRLSVQWGPQKRRGLRLSRLGPTCPRALWYSVHHPEEAEALPAAATIKYSFGHILECLLIALAKAAGHTVTGEQDELVLDGIKGHRDCVIDGCVVDVKSASSRSFQKFKDGSIETDDSFGYLDQLDGYVCASAEDPLVTVKDRGYLFAIDKQMGYLTLYEHRVRKEHIHERIARYKEIVGSAEAPRCQCGTTPDGKSGNIKLDIRASYSPYKFCCFPNLRTFQYSDGKRYLVKVEREPDVRELDKFGKVLYNVQ